MVLCDEVQDRTEASMEMNHVDKYLLHHSHYRLTDLQSDTIYREDIFLDRIRCHEYCVSKRMISVYQVVI